VQRCQEDSISTAIARQARRWVCALAAVLVVSGLCACRSGSGLPQVSLTFTSPTGVVSERFTMEVAATPAERGKGLMFRKFLAANEGMIFLFEQQQRQSFWMKNTLISLDIVFVSSDWKVVGILRDVPPLTEDPRFVSAPSQYVLEFAAGTTARIGLAEGASVSISGTLPPIR
jgi:uncharacterized membrane protein (UPF0127 family)